MAIEHLQVRDVKDREHLFEQQTEELLSWEMKAKERKIAEAEDEVVFKWGLRLKKEQLLKRKLHRNYRKVGWITERKGIRWSLKRMDSKKKEELRQVAIFKPLSYCFKETIGFDVKALFTSCPVSHLISWYNNQVI